MSANESGSSDREKSPSLMRSNDDQGQRSKEVSPKAEEPLKEHPQRKRPKSRRKYSSTDEERSHSPKRQSKKTKKRHRSRSKKNKRKKHRRYTFSPSPSSLSDNSDESKYRNNEGKESTDFRFRMVFEEDQYKQSLPPDIAQYANVNFDTYIKDTDLIKAVLIKNPVPEYINPVKTMNDFVKDILKDKKKQKDLDFGNVLEGRNRSVTSPLSKIWTAVESARLSREDSAQVNLKEIQEFVEQTVLLLGQA